MKAAVYNKRGKKRVKEFNETKLIGRKFKDRYPQLINGVRDGIDLNLKLEQSSSIRRAYTYFAPAERARPEQILQQIGYFQEQGICEEFGDALPIICLILNANRQIIYANREVLEHLDLESTRQAIGKRPGELFKCIHAKEQPGGCGTSKFCENCGSIQAILGAQKGVQTRKECRLTREGGISEDFRIKATPIFRKSEQFTVFTMEDIKDVKRRQALERTFFHDLMNTAAGVSGIAEVLDFVEEQNEKENLLDLLRKTSRRLVEEIHSGRALSQAEDGLLELELAHYDLRQLIDDTVEFYSAYPVFSGQVLETVKEMGNFMIKTDRAIVHRIIANLVKNALEATGKGGTVRINVYRKQDMGVVSVHNDTVMPREVKDQVYMRSFSTKGIGRGIGTYSVKLFTENYLNGLTWFTSEQGSGTTFFLALPLDPEASNPL